MRKSKAIKKAEKGNKVKTKKSLFFRIAVIAFTVYTVYSFVGLQMEKAQTENRIKVLEDQKNKLSTENADLENQAQNIGEYLERIARGQGFARPGESVYIGSPGN